MVELACFSAEYFVEFEITEVRVLRLIDDDIRGLDVAMQNVPTMRTRHPSRDPGLVHYKFHKNGPNRCELRALHRYRWQHEVVLLLIRNTIFMA
jgi:hypothetical protein